MCAIVCILAIVGSAIPVDADRSSGSLTATRLEPPGPGNVSSGSLPEQSEAVDYWTDARLASAEPYPDLVIPGVAPESGPAGAPTGPPVESSGVARPYTNAPDRLVGKVFFTGGDGRDYSCSGSVVAGSRNESVVWTAGHCVYGHDTGGWHHNWIFIPGYSSRYRGQRPYGTWSARTLWSRVVWIDQASYRQDLGAAVVKRRSGRSIEDTVGGLPIAFDAPPTQTYRAIGYPGFGGIDQRQCTSGLRGRDRRNRSLGPDPLYIACDLQPGSSGGPWLRAIGASGIGTISSVNSYRYGGTPDRMYGPYMGGEARSLYNAAETDGVAAGPSNLLVNGDFEAGTSPWRPINFADRVNFANYSGRAYLNSYFQEINVLRSGASFGQDVARSTAVGSQYRLVVFFRMPGACNHTWRGTLALWGVGGAAENHTRAITVRSCEGWKRVEVTLQVRNAGHTALRAEIYGATAGGINIDLDGARLFQV